jgi:hypothetical protein
MLPDDFKGALVRVTRGKGATQERKIVTNDATTLTVTPPWTVDPDSTSFFVVADGTWKFGGVAIGSPADIEVPNRPGTTVEISGRSANVQDHESAYELNPETRWQIGGGLDGGLDADTPPAPVFGLNLTGQGTVELLGIGFTDLSNTHTIAAGTLSLFFWDELSGPTTYALSAAMTDSDGTISITPAGTAAVGTLLQIEREILEVTEVLPDGLQYSVIRGSHGSTASAHGESSPLYHLKRSTAIVPFVRGFFGSEASGSYSHSLFLPDVRIGAAELFMTNAIGGGPVTGVSFGATVDEGLRTLSGGQMSIQVEGYLAIENNAAPPLVIDQAHAPRDMFAVVREAPSGGDVELTLRQGSSAYCSLTIPDGATISNVVNGFGLPPLAADSQLNLDIASVPGAPNTLPGRNLTVTIRL